MPKPEEIDTKQRADRALRAGRPQEALPLYKALLTNVVNYENQGAVYDGWLEGAYAAYRALGERREAAYTLLGLRRFAEAERLLDKATRPVEWALCAVQQGRQLEAAELIATRFPVLAAGAREEGGDLPGARAIWEKLLTTSRLRVRPHETALVHVALARVERALGDVASEARHNVEAVRLLDGLADHYETRGLLESASECYALILRIGRDAGSFENLSEGYLNAIRIAMAEHERYLPLQYSDDFIADAGARDEWSAAASVALEAGDYSRRLGLAFDRHYLGRAAELWTSAARHARSQGLPVEVAENALSAALDAAANLGDLPRLGRIYALLAGLPLDADRVARYTQLATRYENLGESPPPGPGLPDHLRVSDPYRDIGREDLIEWELDGDPAATLALIVVDRRPSEAFKRWALRALLVAARADASGNDDPAMAELALALGGVRLYRVLRPLERLFENRGSAVRSAVMAGAGQVLHQRSFALVRAGLADEDAHVREEARRALRGLHFIEGLDPLVRIYRETKDQSVRETVLAAVGRIGTVEAGLFLMEVVRDDNDQLRALAADRLATFQAADLLPHVRAHIEVMTGPGRQALRAVAQALETVSG